MKQGLQYVLCFVSLAAIAFAQFQPIASTAVVVSIHPFEVLAIQVDHTAK